MRRAWQFVWLGMLFVLARPVTHAEVSFYTVVDLALRNSTQVRIASAEVQHTEAAVKESVDAFKPSFSVGSSLGYSYGFPVGQPSIYSISASSLAYSFSQPSYIRAARAALMAAQLQLKDARQQVILAAGLDYIQLTTLNQQIAALDEENAHVQKLVVIESERVDAGLDRKVELTQARLTGAQIELRRLHLVDQQDLARVRLAHLTGLKPEDVVAEPQTVPATPDISSESGIENTVLEASSGVKAAYAQAKSKELVAAGDARGYNRPTFAFGGEYNRFAKFNNYEDYYLHFQHNNFNVGIQITMPLFDATRKAKAKGSSAAAVEATAQADQMRDQLSEQVLQLKKNIAELSAQERVAALQSELSQDQLEMVTAQIKDGTGNPGMPAPLPKDEQAARIGERNRFVDVLESRFQLTQARLSLLRSLGRIEDWAKTVPAAHP